MSFAFGATSVAPSAGFGFGATPAAAPAASTGFSFGASPAAAPAASTGFSFGATSAAPAASTGFSFGATPAPAAGSTGFGFGTASTVPATTTTTPSFGFGGSAGGFGASTPSTGFGFGATPATGTSSFGTFGAAATAAAAPAAPAAPAVTLETVFEQLPEDVQKNMTEFHAFLKEQDQSDAFLKSVSPHQLEALQQNLARLEMDVLAHRNVQEKQQTAGHAVRKDVRQLIHQVDTASLSLRSMDGSSAGDYAHYYSNIMRRVEMPSPYYWDLLEHFEAQMEAIKRQIQDVEGQFQSAASDASAYSQFHPAQLQQILVAQNAALMQVAARVAETHERAEQMRQLFLAKMRRDLERHGEKNPSSFKNPFDKRKKSAAADQDKRQAIDSIRFRTNVAPTIVTATPAAVAAPTAAPSAFGFGTTTPAATSTGTSAFGSFGATTTTPATSTGGGFSFGATASSATTAGTTAITTSTAPAATTGGFNFGATTSTAPKTVSFNLGGATASSPTTTASPSFGFGAPAAGGASPGGFGSIQSSFLPGATTANTSNKRSTRQKKRS